jgi:uncharacterized damage-inducible protein DinB
MKKSAKGNLLQIKCLLESIKNEDFTRKTDILSGATIGQHVRHILEFYLLLVSCSFSGTICYDKRERDVRIESDKKFASNTIDRLLKGIKMLDENQSLIFEGDFTADGSSQNTIQSSIGRELAYCIEHSIHHQAIIKAGLISLGMGNLANNQFGVAYSTIRYREKKCAQ